MLWLRLHRWGVILAPTFVNFWFSVYMLHRYHLPGDITEPFDLLPQLGAAASGVYGTVKTLYQYGTAVRDTHSSIKKEVKKWKPLAGDIQKGKSYCWVRAAALGKKIPPSRCAHCTLTLNP